MNDYIQTPEGHRVRYTRPDGHTPRLVIDGEVLELGRAHIDQWCPPEPPERT